MGAQSRLVSGRKAVEVEIGERQLIPQFRDTLRDGGVTVPFDGQPLHPDQVGLARRCKKKQYYIMNGIKKLQPNF